MIRVILTMVILACAAATLGCRRDAEPPPLSIGSGGAVMVPVVVPAGPMDRSIIASAPPLAEPVGRAGESPADDNNAPEAEPAAEETPPAENEGAPAEEPEPAEPAVDNQSPPPDNANTSPPPRPERKREEVDEVYSGPGMLRGR